MKAVEQQMISGSALAGSAERTRCSSEASILRAIEYVVLCVHPQAVLQERVEIRKVFVHQAGLLNPRVRRGEMEASE